MPRNICLFPAFALSPRVCNMSMPLKTLGSNRLLQRRFGQPSFESLSIGDLRDRHATEKFCDPALRLLPPRLLRATRAKKTIIGALIETLHQHQWTHDGFINVFN